MSHPVSVIIPTIDSRYEFLVGRCLPSVRAARPAQIVVIGGDGNGNEKRNAGARAATQPFLLFVDDDSTIVELCLELLLAAIEEGGAAFAYSGYKHTVLHEDGRKLPNQEIYPGKWSVDRLRTENYIDMTSLIRRSFFPGFDAGIRRFQDWDLWLTMAAMGFRGVYTPHCLVEKFVIDDGVSVSVPAEEARQTVIRKHCL